MESPAFQTRVMALGHYWSHVFLQELQILQQRTLEIIAAHLVLGHAFHLFQDPRQLATFDRMARGPGATEVQVSQALDRPHT